MQFDVQSHRRSVVTFSVEVQAMMYARHSLATIVAVDVTLHSDRMQFSAGGGSILSVEVDCGVAAD